MLTTIQDLAAFFSWVRANPVTRRVTTEFFKDNYDTVCVSFLSGSTFLTNVTQLIERTEGGFIIMSVVRVRHHHL
jgi:hypothetical protein